ncbi:MAG: ABC transporter ATP-binding protein [Chloroflexi bacterium]|nr:ABC transporter ATP-binding protein [Chloroflexota bacterium]
MTEVLVETERLVKAYGTFRAVDGLDLRLNEGEVYGFLGPNGSGKSTTILMMLGLTEPTSGMVRVVGHNPTREPIAVKRQVGYLPESVGFYADMSGKDNLMYTADLNNIRRSEASTRIDELLEMVELGPARDQVVGQYSRGMRQRLGLADVLLKRPKVIILDDPTLGLDPTGIQWLLEIIGELSSKQGISIFVSSHQLHEVQRVCHRVGIMSHGKLVLEGTVAELTKKTESGGFGIVLDVIGGDETLVTSLRQLPGVRSCEREGTQIIIEGDQDVRAQAIATAVASSAELLGATSENRTLEDIYLRYFAGAEG